MILAKSRFQYEFVKFPLLTEFSDRICSITYYTDEAYIGCCEEREGAVIMALF